MASLPFIASEKSMFFVGIFNSFSHSTFPASLNMGIPNIHTAAVMSSFLSFSAPSIIPPLLYPAYERPISVGISSASVPQGFVGLFNSLMLCASML
jgi:hypothetical protein